MASLDSIGKARRLMGFSDKDLEDSYNVDRVIGVAQGFDQDEKQRLRDVDINPYDDMRNIGKRYPKGSLDKYRKKKFSQSKPKRKVTKKKSCGCK